MEAIRNLIEWVANDGGSTAATLFPYLLVGLVGAYLLWLVLGYLRVSQVGADEGRAAEMVVPLPRAPEGTVKAPPGVPYCAYDGLQYPLGARFCTSCERDLWLDCRNCGATLRAVDTSCYRCGVATGVAETSLLS
jgi:hypothetical protein